MDDQPAYVLEEQLARQKLILSNSKLIQKLPDKGAKLKDSVAKIEEELVKRRKEAELSQRPAVVDIGELEWSLRSSPSTTTTTSTPGNDPNSTDVVLDSDDDEEDNSEESQNPLQIIATSQISQRQPKPTLSVSDNPKNKDVQVRDLYVSKLIANDVKTTAVHISHPKFLPSKLQKKSEEGAGSSKLMELSTKPTSPVISVSSSNTKPPKWDECLLPPTHAHKNVALLSMEETIKISSVQYKKAQEVERIEAKAKTNGKKTYAYDKLREQGLENYTVAMQTSRPVRTDAEEDDFEEDSNDDEITDESECNDSDDDDDNNDETSKDLSNLVNTSLKLSS